MSTVKVCVLASRELTQALNRLQAVDQLQMTEENLQWITGASVALYLLARHN